MNGVHVPLVTPFTDDGAVDVPSLERLAHHILDHGAAGLVALGTTGEAPMLTEAECRTVVEVCRRVSDAYGTPLTVGAGTAGTDDSVRQAKERAEAADLLLAVVPYYLRPTDEGVVEHFAAVGAATGVPLVVYNVPYRTGKTLRAETLLALLAADHVAGVKHCPGSVDADTLTLLAGSRDVLCGDDAFLYPMLALGAAGGIAASGNVAPAAFAAMISAVRAGDAERGRSLHRSLLPLTRALFAEPSPSVIKAVLARQGLIARPAVRAPLRAPAADSLDAAMDALAALDAGWTL
ncbi:4-hydroxy-tetrahydrodipicolinate synthase [Actinoallomurus iriomotensis]|uniref:4-hydroxy-tetrahydrodipicolinate synthase n=1 Tax=Actinoallomurus iriomotensis TaxID=478107 RepID=A0A9W6VTM4_9ACTN|nr:4-hydroxy-tetrahydrodipicolinate synthase [Actinoallomurus iriomotensis]GLY79895.1 4-hydroxy-tetrahydrodipicolinate synthase [Actinoallomurus iriomotensis]